MTRLPKILAEEVLLALHARPSVIAQRRQIRALGDLRVLKIHVQVAGCDGILAGFDAVSEPGEGAADEHRAAQHDGQNACQQSSFGIFALCHLLLPPKILSAFSEGSDTLRESRKTGDCL